MKKLLTIMALMSVLSLTACGESKDVTNDYENENLEIGEENIYDTVDEYEEIDDFIITEDKYPVVIYDGTTVYAEEGIWADDVQVVLDANQNIDLDEIDVEKNNIVFHFAGSKSIIEATRDFGGGYWNADHEKVAAQKYERLSIAYSEKYSSAECFDLYTDNRTEDIIEVKDSKVGYAGGLYGATVNGMKIESGLKITDFVDKWGTPFAVYAYTFGDSTGADYLWKFNDGYIIITTPYDNGNTFNNIHLYAKDAIYDVDLERFEDCLKRPEEYVR